MAPTIKKLPRAKSREEWLNNAIRLARPIFRKLNCPLPKKVRAACSWTSHGARSAAIGQCWTYLASQDQTVEIHVSPVLDDVLTEGKQGVLDVFVHELGHAAAGIPAGHKGEFARVARELGLPRRRTRAPHERPTEAGHANAQGYVQRLRLHTAHHSHLAGNARHAKVPVQ